MAGSRLAPPPRARVADDPRHRGPRSGVNLPLPPPAADGDEPISRVRMSGLVADHTARAVPTLPIGPGWDLDDTTDEDAAFDSVTSAVRVSELAEPPALAAARRADRATVAGVKSAGSKSARRLP